MKNIYFIIFIFAAHTSVAQIFSTEKDTANYSGIELGEITISSSKSDMQLKNLPSSVTLLTETSINDDNIKNLTDITSISPSLFMPSYGSKLTSPIYIRGIGSRINAPGVGLYVDHVPYFDKSAFNFDFFDIERIEVLKGPQGTLYGRNTMGGVINIKTLSPIDYQGVKALVGVGSYGQYEALAGVYHKINDKVAASLTTLYNRRDGFYDNELLNETVDNAEVFGARARVVWNPIKQLTIENIASVEKSDEGGYPYSIYDSLKQAATPIRHDQPSFYNRLMFSDALVSAYKTDDLEIRLTSSFQYIDDEQGIDQDFSETPRYFVNQTQQQFLLSEELLVRSVNKSIYNWLFGAMYFLQDFDKEVNVDIIPANRISRKTYEHSISGAALFHQSELTLGDLTLTGGIRLDFEKDKQDYAAASIVNKVVTLVDEQLETFRFFEILPKVAANYRFNGTNLFLSVARGYKTGGFNSSFDADRPQDMTYDSEYSMNYEAGMKTSLINKQLYADLAVYFIDIDQQQIYQSNPSGVGSRLTNAGRSSSTGFEASVKTVPICGYVTSVSYGYNHATFKNYTVDETLNYNHNFIPYAPQHTLSVRLSKSYAINQIEFIDKVRISLLYNGLGKTYWNEENTTVQNYYNLLSTKISIVKNDFAINFWMKNILDSKYHVFSFQTSTGTYVQEGRPMNFGISLSYNL